MTPIARGVLLAAVSAITFGLTAPVIEVAGEGLGPLTIAALLYAGALGLSTCARPFVAKSGVALRRANVPRLLLVAFSGAMVAPTLLAWGIARAGATASSLVLNFEAVLTVLLAAALYREPIGRRVGLAIVAMLAGGAMVAASSSSDAQRGELLGLLAVVGATAGWALDSTLTRGLSEIDPFEVVTAKAGLGAAVTAAAAWAFGEPMPAAWQLAALLACGATGYGLSLRLYLLAQRRIGAARTASVFATGPFVGAVAGMLAGGSRGGLAMLVGGLAFGAGAWLHITERHRHRHLHRALEHEHEHRHDDGHHDHVHEPPVVGAHTHGHRHDALEHDHAHAPDLHHDHEHA